MENKGGRGGGSRQEPPRPNSCSQIICEEVQPYFDWKQYSNFHVLTLHIPGCVQKEKVKLKVNDYERKITISGKRKESENKYIRFKQAFDAPADSNTKKISAEFEKGLLFVIMPKDIKNGPIDKLLDQISKNKAMIIAIAVLAFSLGLYVSHKLQ